MERFLIAIAALSGAAAVIADASAQHLLAGDPARVELAATAARYGLMHAAALVGVAALLHRGGPARGWLLASAWCFSAALVLFCGTLYLHAGGLAPWLLPLVPAGGLLFIAAWVLLGVHALAPRPPA
jgi:uncharacterized membrane protein YgdD (TMEM256/DUF423 family)